MHPQFDPAAEHAKTEQSKRRLFFAGQVATWVWVAITGGTILLVLACCAFCGLGAVIGGTAPSPTVTP